MAAIDADELNQSVPAAGVVRSNVLGNPIGRSPRSSPRRAPGHRDRALDRAETWKLPDCLARATLRMPISARGAGDG